MSEPAFDASLTADGDGEGAGDDGVFSSLRATTSSTRPRAFCRIDIACWCEMLESSGWPSIARIWSPSCNRPSLKKINKI